MKIFHTTCNLRCSLEDIAIAYAYRHVYLTDKSMFGLRQVIVCLELPF